MRFCWYGLLPQKQKHPILITHILYVLLEKPKRDTKGFVSKPTVPRQPPPHPRHLKDTLISDSLLYSKSDLSLSLLIHLLIDADACLILLLLAPYFSMNTSFLIFLFDKSSNISIFSSSVMLSIID